MQLNQGMSFSIYHCFFASLRALAIQCSLCLCCFSFSSSLVNTFLSFLTVFLFFVHTKTDWTSLISFLILKSSVQIAFRKSSIAVYKNKYWANPVKSKYPASIFIDYFVTGLLSTCLDYNKYNQNNIKIKLNWTNQNVS